MIVRTVAQLKNGSPKERLRCLFDMAAWFAMGAFLVSVLGYYVDPFIPADLSGNGPAVIGGIIAMVGGAFHT